VVYPTWALVAGNGLLKARERTIAADGKVADGELVEVHLFFWFAVSASSFFRRIHMHTALLASFV